MDSKHVEQLLAGLTPEQKKALGQALNSILDALQERIVAIVEAVSGIICECSAIVADMLNDFTDEMPCRQHYKWPRPQNHRMPKDYRDKRLRICRCRNCC